MWAALIIISAFLVLPPTFYFWGVGESRTVLLISFALVGTSTYSLLSRASQPTGALSSPGRPSCWAGLLVVWLTVSWWLTLHRAGHGKGVLLMIGCGLLLLYGMPFRVKGLDWALWAALILQAGLVAWQMVGRDPISFVAGGTNITVNRSDLANIDIVHYAWGSLLNTGRTAAWAALVLPVAALSKRLPAWARVSGLLAGLFVLDAMGSILGYLAAAFALGAYLYHRRIVSGRTAIILCGVFLFTFSVLAFQHGETAQRRVQVWKAAVWWMQHSRPNEWVFGKGLGGFAELDIRDPEHPKKFIVWKKAHNEFVQLGVEAGAVALALFLGLWIASFRTAARARDGGVTLASLAALAVIASGHFPFREPTLAILSLSVLARVLSWEHLTCPKTAAISV